MTSTSLLPSIHRPHHSPFRPNPCFNVSGSSFHFNSFVCFSSPINASNSDREEIRWLREEQRWLREEQRWLREEHRWLRERDFLLREISSLKLQIQALESQNSVKDSSPSESITSTAGLLQELKAKNNLIAESASSSWPIDLGEKREIDEQEKKVVVEDNVRISEIEEKEEEEESKALRMGSDGEQKKKDRKAFRMGSDGEQEKKDRKALRMGSEGEEVQAMQVCLQ